MSAATAANGEHGAAFGLRTTIALVVAGAVLFVALLWMIGTGLTGNTGNDGGSHVGGRGLNGFAGFARYLEQRGIPVRRAQSKAALADPGLLILTPPPAMDGKDLDRIVAHRRYIGPTLVVLPKWRTMPVGDDTPGGQRGWTRLEGVAPPEWRGFLDGVTVGVAPLAGGWRGAGLAGALPEPRIVLGAAGDALVPLVRGADGRMLAAYVRDTGYYPTLARIAGRPDRVPSSAHAPDHGEDAEDTEDASIYPLVLVVEPDLIDNYGMQGSANASLGERLVRATGGDALQRPGGGVVFDMTLNGFTRSPNLLTLAFTPPFLAGTLCLLLAAVAAGWRAFVRFGPPRREDRAIAFGKRALVANAAGLIGRSGRLHLLGLPYAAASRERLVRALGLPRAAGIAETDAAIDRALARRPGHGQASDTPLFSVLVARLAGARRRQDVLDAATALHTLERTLTR